MVYIIECRIECQLKKTHVAVIVQALIRELNGLLFWSNDHLVNCKSWCEVKVEVESNLKLIVQDPYSCAIKAKDKYFRGWKMVHHIPREILQHVYFSIKQEGGRVYGKLKQNPLWFLPEVFKSHCYSSLNPKTNVSRIQWTNLSKISILSILQVI